MLLLKLNLPLWTPTTFWPHLLHESAWHRHFICCAITNSREIRAKAAQGLPEESIKQEDLRVQLSEKAHA